jgi:hypothetical protein
MRIAASSLLEGYRATLPDGALRQVHRARPMSIHVPAAFVDAINEGEVEYTAQTIQRTPTAVIRFVRGTFNAADVADANDELVDGFVEYVANNIHSAGASTIAVITSIEDDDGWVPDWIPVREGQTPIPYYSTVLSLGGEGQFGRITT